MIYVLLILISIQFPTNFALSHNRFSWGIPIEARNKRQTLQFNDYDDSVLDDLLLDDKPSINPLYSVLDDLKANDYADIEVPGALDKDFEKEIVVSNDTESDYFYRITVKAHVRIRKDNLTQVRRSIMHVYPQIKN